MEKLIDNLEFGNVKLLRKNLIISSATAIVVSQLVEYSEGAISFLVFTIPENNKPILNKLMFCIVLYYIIALAIRYYDEEFLKWYKKEMRSIEIYNNITYARDSQTSIDQRYFKKKVRGWDEFRKALLLAIDIVFPFVLGLVALYYSFSF